MSTAGILDRFAGESVFGIVKMLVLPVMCKPIPLGEYEEKYLSNAGK
jgi:hypothetical protein